MKLIIIAMWLLRESPPPALGRMAGRGTKSWNGTGRCHGGRCHGGRRGGDLDTNLDQKGR